MDSPGSVGPSAPIVSTDMSNEITTVTRKNIIDELTLGSLPWSGNLEEAALCVGSMRQKDQNVRPRG